MAAFFLFILVCIVAIAIGAIVIALWPVFLGLALFLVILILLGKVLS